MLTWGSLRTVKEQTGGRVGELNLDPKEACAISAEAGYSL